MATRYTSAKCPRDATAPTPKNVYGAVGPTKARPKSTRAHKDSTGFSPPGSVLFFSLETGPRSGDEDSAMSVRRHSCRTDSNCCAAGIYKICGIVCRDTVTSRLARGQGTLWFIHRNAIDYYHEP